MVHIFTLSFDKRKSIELEISGSDISKHFFVTESLNRIPGFGKVKGH